MELKHFESLYPEKSRFEEIQKIISLLKLGKSCQIIGLPGVGKSNLLRMLAYNKNIRLLHLGDLQKKVHFVYMDLSEIIGKNLNEINKFIFLSLADSFKERGIEIEHIKLHKVYEEYSKNNDELLLFQGLKEALQYLCVEKKYSVCLLFDKAEEFLAKAPLEFFSNLTILRNKAKYRFSVIFSLGRTIESFNKGVISTSFFEHLSNNLIFLPLLDKEGLNFRIDYLLRQKDKKINSKVLKEVISLTNGHGKLTRICLENIDNHIQNLMHYLLAQKNVLLGLEEIWNFLSKEEQKYLKTKEKLNENKINFLNKIQLLQKEEINIPLFREYIKRKSIERENVILDEHKNILIGEVNLTEKLTQLENKLLLYLLENRERLITRDELINAVWCDSKTTEGVTNEAVDKLISRVRKKLLANSNSTSSIVSIKGKGLKLSTQ